MESVWTATHHPTSTLDPFAPDAHVDTVVVGAGLTGLATAVMLARANQRVVVLEARHVGAVATGNTTAKVSLLQGLTLSQLRKHQDDEHLRAYVEANRQGQAWLLAFLGEHGIDHQRRTAWTHATTEEGLGALRQEQEACVLAGLDVSWTTETELPFPVLGALALPDQAQIHPLLVLDALVAELRQRGGQVVEGVRVTNVHTHKGDDHERDGQQGAGQAPVRIDTDAGRMSADHLVLATGTPILDRGGHFARLSPHRSYATTHRLPADVAVPQGMYLSADDPTRSLRSVSTPEGELLMVGGNGHVVGRHDSPRELVLDLQRWTADHFPGAVPVHAWSAQDYRSASRLPFMGPMPRTDGLVQVATGFNKWGMTNGVAAGLAITAELRGESLDWARTIQKPTLTASSVMGAIVPNAQVAAELAKDWVAAELHTLPEHSPAEGEGFVGRGAGGRPEAVSTVEGRTCTVSGVCTHLGGVLRWNDAENSWDCPLHGSRFAADGSLLEGPATSNLRQL